jgi:hypothetical protein
MMQMYLSSRRNKQILEKLHVSSKISVRTTKGDLLINKYKKFPLLSMVLTQGGVDTEFNGSQRFGDLGRTNNYEFLLQLLLH